MGTPAIFIRSDQLTGYLKRAGIASVHDLGRRLGRISTTRRQVLGETPTSAGFIAGLLTLLGPVGAKFDDLFVISEGK